MTVTDAALRRVKVKADAVLKGKTEREKEEILFPLVYWMVTARCSGEEVYKVRNATERQLTTIVKRLEKANTEEDAMKSIEEYVRRI